MDNEYERRRTKFWLLPELLAKTGAIVSSAGIALFIAFVAILLIFPVIKECNSEGRDCTYSSTAPDPFQAVVQPGYLAGSLLTIAAGVFLVRFARWRGSKKLGPGA
jgi:hypothetical protein